MNLRTILIAFLLLNAIILGSCGSKSPGNTPATVEEAEKQLAKEAKKTEREEKKAKKEACKR